MNDVTLHRHKDGSLASTELDAARTLAGELIAAIRINAMRETFATATPEQVYEWLKPYILRLNSAGEP